MVEAVQAAAVPDLLVAYDQWAVGFLVPLAVVALSSVLVELNDSSHQSGSIFSAGLPSVCPIVF